MRSFLNFSRDKNRAEKFIIGKRVKFQAEWNDKEQVSWEVFRGNLEMTQKLVFFTKMKTG